MAVLFERSASTAGMVSAVERAAQFPRLRFMGSKYKVVPALVDLVSRLDCDSILDAFSGSGVVGYAFKALGKQVTTNDFLAFTATVARATVENGTVRLSDEDVSVICSGNQDGRDFISRTFRGLYFPPADLAFLDAAWSQVDSMPSRKRDLALAALCLASARKQPRGVFTVTDLRYDDGRRQLRAPLKELFVEAAAEYTAAVFANGRENRSLCQDVFELDPEGYDVVYLDPPYAPPRDDNCYIKRYHFLEGLATYWRGQRILEETKTKKLAKRFTPFSYKTTIREALRETFARFRRSTIILSYSSNSVPGENEVFELLRREKPSVEVLAIPHRYSFGTHPTALRRSADEYIFVGR